MLDISTLTIGDMQKLEFNLEKQGMWIENSNIDVNKGVFEIELGSNSPKILENFNQIIQSLYDGKITEDNLNLRELTNEDKNIMQNALNFLKSKSTNLSLIPGMPGIFSYWYITKDKTISSGPQEALIMLGTISVLALGLLIISQMD